VRKNLKLTQEQHNQVQMLFASRQRASLWENFSRRWQGVPSEGGEQVRQTLGLDHRPVVLLATNVIGDSLTLGRQVFSNSMTEWLERTVQFFNSHPEVQLVARIHPGEMVTKGPSVAEVVQKTLTSIPENIHLVPADARVNTYDIVEIADVGLVYTTTVGMEMSMRGIPVIVVGNTHYRNKGFTQDPETWSGYFELLTNILVNPIQYRLTQEQVAQAWNYAYRFFFEYPHPFPWHLLHMWKDLDIWPLSRLLAEQGMSTYQKTFSYLVGEPVIW
jgi:capsule polysaccharide export protein KpsC/LpsZ